MFIKMLPIILCHKDNPSSSLMSIVRPLNTSSIMCSKITGGLVENHGELLPESIHPSGQALRNFWILLQKQECFLQRVWLSFSVILLNFLQSVQNYVDLFFLLISTTGDVGFFYIILVRFDSEWVYSRLSTVIKDLSRFWKDCYLISES